MFGCNFAPTGWAECNGQLLPISQNTALFSLLGTTYGGDGKSTFALPDLRDRTPLQHGQGQGLSERYLGEQGGASYVTLTTNEIPAHAHQLYHAGTAATSAVPGPSSGLGETGMVHIYSGSAASTVPMANGALSYTGAGQPHNNRQPYLGVMFCIAMQGVFPPRG